MNSKPYPQISTICKLHNYSSFCPYPPYLNKLLYHTSITYCYVALFKQTIKYIASFFYYALNVIAVSNMTVPHSHSQFMCHFFFFFVSSKHYYFLILIQSWLLVITFVFLLVVVNLPLSNALLVSS